MKLTQPMIGAIFGSLLTAIPFLFAVTDKNLDRDHKQQACLVFIGALSVLWGAKVHASGKVAAAQASAGGSTPDPTPTTPVIDPQLQQMFQDVWSEIATLKGKPGTISPQAIAKPSPSLIVVPKKVQP
jgi:hypothetical protein